MFGQSTIRDAEEAYFYGLWCADAYWWSSSIGLSNVEPELIVRFGKYLEQILPNRLRIRVYMVPGHPPHERVMALTDRVSICPAYKMKRTAYHVYVNSRPLVRLFVARRNQLEELAPSLIAPYIAGRFDGDGCLGTTVRIAYSKREEAELDARLLHKVGIRTSVLHYERVNEYCVYFKKNTLDRFFEMIEERSWKLAESPRRDLLA